METIRGRTNAGSASVCEKFGLITSCKNQYKNRGAYTKNYHSSIGSQLCNKHQKKKTQNEIRFGFRRRPRCCARRSSRSKRRYCLEIRKRQHRSWWIQFRVSVQYSFDVKHLEHANKSSNYQFLNLRRWSIALRPVMDKAVANKLKWRTPVRKTNILPYVVHTRGSLMASPTPSTTLLTKMVSNQKVLICQKPLFKFQNLDTKIKPWKNYQKKSICFTDLDLLQTLLRS